MKKAFRLIVSLCAGLVLSDVCLAKGREFSWYPPEFERLGAADWPEMKTTLDALDDTKRDADVSPVLLEKVWFTLNRISQIKWEAAMRDQVRDYLLDFAEERMERAGSSHATATKAATTEPRPLAHGPAVTTPADLAHVAVWSCGKIADVIPSSQRLVGLWRPAPPSTAVAHRKLRWSILLVLNDRFADSSIPELVQKLSDMKPVSADEAINLERIRRKHELSRFNHQKQAWEYVWSVTKPDRPEEVLTAKYRRNSGEWYVLMEKVYPLDPAIAMSISDSATDQYKKYAFLNDAVCILRNQFFRRAEIDGSVLVDQNQFKEVESKAQAMVAAMARTPAVPRVDGYQNYLKDSLQSLRTQAVRPPRPKAEKETEPPLINPEPADDPPPAALPNTPPRKGAQVGPGTAIRPVAEEHRPTFTRPEDRGEDFSKLDSHEVVRRLAVAEGVAEQRKAAKVLGDREIAGTLELTEEDRRIVQRQIDTQIEWTGAAAGSDRSDASEQLQRLWTLAAPQLMDNLGHESSMVRDAAIKNLSLMRNEDLVLKLIARIEASDDPRVRQFGIFALGRMLEKRESLIPGRVQINDESSQAITDRLVSPFLDRWEEAHQDAETKEAITGARRALKHPLDTRLRPAPDSAQNAPLAAVLTPVADPQPNPSVGPVPVQDKKPQASISPGDTPTASPPTLPEQKAPSTTAGTTLVIALVLAAIGVTAGFLYWRRS